MASTLPWQLEHEESPSSCRSCRASRPQHIENDETGRSEATWCSLDETGHPPHRAAGFVPVLYGDDHTRNHHPAVGHCRRATSRPNKNHLLTSCSHRAHHSTVTFILSTILLQALIILASGHHDGYGFESNRDHVIPTETDNRDVGSSFAILPINYTLQFPSCGSSSTFLPSVDQLRLFEGATESFLGSALAQVFPGGRGGFQQLELYADDYIVWDENNRRRRRIEEDPGHTDGSFLRRRAQFLGDEPPMVVTLLFSGNAKFRYTPPVNAVGEVAHVCEYMLTYHLHGLVDEVRRTFSNAVAQARVVGSSVDTNVCSPNNFGTTSSVMDVAPGSIPAGQGLGGGNEEGFGLNEMDPQPPTTSGGGGNNKRVPRPQGGPTVNNDDGGGGGGSRQPVGPETLAAESEVDGESGEPSPSSPSMGMLLGIVGSAGAALALVSLGAVYFIRLRREEEAEANADVSSNGGGRGGGSKKARRRLEPMGGDGSTSSSVGDDLGMAEEDGTFGSFRNNSVGERNNAGYWDQASTSLASGRGPRQEHERGGGDGGGAHPEGNFVSGGAVHSKMQQERQHPQQQHQTHQAPPQQQQKQPPQQQQQQKQQFLERTIVGKIDDLDHPCDQRSTIPSVVSVPSGSASSSDSASSSPSSEACSSKGWSSARSHDGSHEDEEEEYDEEGAQTSANNRPTSHYMYGASGEDAGSCYSSSGSSDSMSSSCVDHDGLVATEDKMVVDDDVKINNDQDRPREDGLDSEDRVSVVTIEEIRQAKLPPAVPAAEVSADVRPPPAVRMHKSSSAGIVTPPKAAKRVTVSEPAPPIRASSDTQICGPGVVFKTVILGGGNKGKRGGENCDQSFANTASLTTATSTTDSFEESNRERNTSVLRGPSFRWLRSKGGSRGRNHQHGSTEIEDDRLSMSAFSIGSHEDHHFTATQHPEEEARRRIMAVRDGSSRLMMINRSSSSEWEGGADGRHNQRPGSQAQSQSRRGSSSSFLHPGRIRRVSIASSMSMASSSGDAADDAMNKAGSEIRRYTHGDGDGGPRASHITEEDIALRRMMMARSRSRRTQRG